MLDSEFGACRVSNGKGIGFRVLLEADRFEIF